MYHRTLSGVRPYRIAFTTTLSLSTLSAAAEDDVRLSFLSFFGFFGTASSAASGAFILAGLGWLGGTNSLYR